MPKRLDIQSVLVIGAGPIVIGQACEFDYSGVQACKALREEGYRVVLVNSNPATIMTDPEFADATYIEPITWEIVAQIIEKERPDALLPTMGGQTGLNCSLDLVRHGVLEKFGVEMIGATRDAIDKADIPVTTEERTGFSYVPTSVNFLRNSAGLLPETLLTVPTEATSILEAQLRKSTINVRPGNRVAGSIIFGSAGARISFNPCSDPDALQSKLLEFFKKNNTFNLKITLRKIEGDSENTSFDLILTSSTKDPHSGMNGGPFPVAELQLARMIDQLVNNDGSLVPEIQKIFSTSSEKPGIKTQSLFVEKDESAKLFEDPSAKAMVEIRLAPGNQEKQAEIALKTYLQEKLPKDYMMKTKFDRGAAPWITPITHPVFPIVLEALEMGYDRKACTFGCGGSIPFVAKLTNTIPGTQPLCLGPYDPDSRMHEPGESLSMADLLGCTKSILHLIARIDKAF